MSFILIDDGEISYHNPFGTEKTKELEYLLRSSNCFAPSFVGVDAYAVETYILQYALHRTETIFLLDRNVYSDVIKLAKGEPENEATKVSAAIMAFASCVTATLEPSLALYEGSASGARGGWKRDLALFHASDEINAVNWVMLALGHAERFEQRIRRKRPVERSEERFNPKMRLRSFGFNYPALLKLAIIYRRGGDRNAGMIEFLEPVRYL